MSHDRIQAIIACTLARVAEALGRHLIVSFPEKVPARLEDAVQVA